ncbi:histidine kinase [Nonomuraea sp. NBC_01738]|uniref:sensor histidine kinase n=1 Tax=Nonomuraea sp. NBC_01738 TaxID=2976003 RepID=UPI002E102708|nr:histidine kinase [Nonomuraea sp. NBC_01738]
MAARPEVARKVLLYWMDGVIVMLAIIMTVLMFTYLRDGQITLPRAIAAELCLLGIFGALPLILRAAYDATPRPNALLVVTGFLALGALLLIPPDTVGAWECVGGLWLSAAAVHLSWRVTAPIAAVVLVVTVAVGLLITGKSWTESLLNGALTVVVMPFAMWLWLWLWRTIKEAHGSQEAKAKLAVSEERLRFARDLHDLLGHSLSVITLKSELAAKLATKDTGRAAAEMSQVRGLAGDALAEVRAAVEGYRTLSLDQELDGVRATLEAAGTRCEIRVAADDLTPASRTLLAWAVREGATNILKHSTATRCEITIDAGVLVMRNDGVHRTMDGAEPPGSGLRGLSERLATAGGTFSAAPTGSGEFLLRAAVPA